VQVVADKLHVGALALHDFLGELGNLVAVRVVLVDQVDLLDLRKVFHVGGQRFHLHGGVGIQAEVPVAALAVGQVRVHRGVVEEQHFLAGVAGVVLFQRVHDGQSRARAIALHHIAGTLVHGGAQGAGGFLRAELVVDADDFKLDAGWVLFVELFRQELEALELVGSHRCHQARERV
jgi:hypothetical protein